MGLEKNKADTGGKPLANKLAAPAKAPAKTDKEKGEGRGRKSQFKDKRIYLTPLGAKENPCRKDSERARQYDIVKEGMSYEDYQKAGGSAFNLNDGIQRGYFKVK